MVNLYHGPHELWNIADGLQNSTFMYLTKDIKDFS